MNKIFKRVVATLLTVSAFATIEPAKYINLMTTQAHADEAKTEFKVKEVEVKKSSGSSGLQLYDSKKCKSKDKVDFDEKDSKYYVNIKSGNRVYIDLDVDGDYDYKIKKGSKKYEENEKIPVSSSSTKISIDVWPKDKSESDGKRYTIYVQCDRDRDDDDDDDDDDYDEIYLDRLKVGGETIKLKESKTSYSIDFDKSTSSVKIIAEPEDGDDCKVYIDGKRVDDDDDYKKTVSLKEGKNEFEIKLKEDDDRRTYTLTINRGKSSDKDSDDKESNKETNKPIKADQWITVNGNLVYNDSTGNPIKNSWFLDRNFGTWYLFDAYGYARKGWAYTNGTWYYLNPYTGQMQTGWTYVNGTWYYLNQYSGAMQTGWVYDNGVWYYCNSSGAMLKNTTIGGYRLGWNGAWIR
ncbi:cadherin-like beta sandwich domain-containing protein [Clostridium weizhouense]|uniref:Cadherin-like beta sandwich domain-containing protein n=1 Tax=Clostridium weizhouense TaxID=2859781 RepID=A0ABS7ANW5_9CLOT|nr:cadherin-like beta sandwich domain-containing protein [Clostridium weizhouense]MBW6410322.1 cadherin-like beta sandwich domain-containing protein [Clostridium weizhouense]